MLWRRLHHQHRRMFRRLNVLIVTFRNDFLYGSVDWQVQRRVVIVCVCVISRRIVIYRNRVVVIVVVAECLRVIVIITVIVGDRWTGRWGKAQFSVAEIHFEFGLVVEVGYVFIIVVVMINVLVWIETSGKNRFQKSGSVKLLLLLLLLFLRWDVAVDEGGELIRLHDVGQRVERLVNGDHRRSFRGGRGRRRYSW